MTDPARHGSDGGGSHRLGHAVRRATLDDIDRLIAIRGAVTENRLSDPTLVTRGDYEAFVGAGRVWVAEAGGRIAGFAAGDVRDGTIWALFIDPPHQGAGLGSLLLRHACADLAAAGFATVRLTTDPGTLADAFYRRRGWTATGRVIDGEVEFVRASGEGNPSA